MDHIPQWLVDIHVIVPLKITSRMKTISYSHTQQLMPVKNIASLYKINGVGRKHSVLGRSSRKPVIRGTSIALLHCIVPPPCSCSFSHSMHFALLLALPLVANSSPAIFLLPLHISENNSTQKRGGCFTRSSFSRAVGAHFQSPLVDDRPLRHLVERTLSFPALPIYPRLPTTYPGVPRHSHFISTVLPVDTSVAGYESRRPWHTF